jgi:hypothetical protein
MSSKFVGAKKLFFSGFSKVFKGPQDQGKVATIGGVRPAKNLKQKFDAKQKLFKGVDKKGSNLSTVQKGKFKKEGSQEIDRIFKKYEKKADGGRIGRRFGGDTMKKKTNVEKIKETFSPKGKNLKPVDPKKQKGLAKLPRKVRNNMGYMKSGGRA